MIWLIRVLATFFRSVWNINRIQVWKHETFSFGCCFQPVFQRFGTSSLLPLSLFFCPFRTSFNADVSHKADCTNLNQIFFQEKVSSESHIPDQFPMICKKNTSTMIATFFSKVGFIRTKKTLLPTYIVFFFTLFQRLEDCFEVSILGIEHL